MGDISKDDPVITPFSAHSLAKCLASPTSSLEVIASVGEETKKKKKVGGKSFLPSFWDDADAAALKAYVVTSMDDLNHLMRFLVGFGGVLVRFWETCGFGEEGGQSEPMIKSLSTENETLKNKVVIFTVKAENNKERVVAFEKSLQVKKDFCKLKDKQIGDLELKLQKAGVTAVQEFKDFDEYSDELCGYYVEGFDLLRKWMVKHHLDLDLFGLVIGDVKKELLSDRPSEAIAENVMEEAIIVVEVIEEAVPITPADPVPNEQ
nr:hypothetical protein CFP56_33832 [Quercus suber]